MKKKKTIYNILFVFGILVIIGTIILVAVKFPIFIELFGVIILSFVISYTLRPICIWLVKHGINRKLSSALIIIGLIVGLILIWVILIPAIYAQSSNLNDTINEIKYYIQRFSSGLEYSGENEILNQVLSTAYSKMQIIISGLATKVIDKIINLAGNLALLLITPTLAYFFLSDGENIFNGIMRFVPGNSKDIVRRVMLHIDKVMQRYIITQFELCGIIGVLTYVALLISGVKYPLILAIINAIFNIIPYFGPIIGAVPIVLISLIISTKKAIVVIFWLFIIQQLEGDIICPKVLGESISSHPATVLLLLIIGGSIGGIMGMILIVPIWVMAKIIYDEVEYYLF